MTRPSLFFLIALGSAATAAVAAIGPMGKQAVAPNHNVTVINMTTDFPYYGPVEVDECQIEDCSDE